MWSIFPRAISSLSDFDRSFTAKPADGPSCRDPTYLAPPHESPHDSVTVTAPSASNPSPDDARVVARVFALTDVGLSREHNEDTFLVADLDVAEEIRFGADARPLPVPSHGLLFLVADGMGGAASGEIASSMASDAVLAVLKEQWLKADTSSPAAFASSLRDATTVANGRIFAFAQENPEHRGMGTTATIAGLVGDTLYVAQVGDSRAYLVRDGVAKQLTKDQSLMQRLVEAGELTQEQADASDRRNIILQALGPEAQITIDLTHQQVRKGDTLIICSDGLSGLVRPDEMARFSSETDDVRKLCERLVTRANELGGPDNITVIAARFEGEALVASKDGDEVGYRTFPLAGTLNHDTNEVALPNTPLKAHLRSDPTPRYGTPQPNIAAIEEVAAHLVDTDQQPVVLGAPEAVVVERRQQVGPIYYVLALIAVLAAAWVLYNYVSKSPK